MYFDFFSRRWVFAPDGNPSGGQAPSSEPPAADQAPAAAPGPAQDAQATEHEKTISKLNAENAKWRTQLREAQEAIKGLQAEAGDSKKLSGKLAELESTLAQKVTEAETAQKIAQLMRLAVKAGVDPDVAALLDLSKIDLADEKKALETLGRLAGAGKSSQAKPNAVGNTGLTEEELRDRYFGGKRQTTIFGG